jgi:hypothetical protein
MIKPGYKTSEFWFTLVTFLFSGLYLLGVIGDIQQKDEIISNVTHAVESCILIGGQLIVLYKYIKGRSEIKQVWWSTASEEERKIAGKQNVKRKTNAKRTSSTRSKKVSKQNKSTDI